jgi:hypothetical protein
MEGVAVTIHRFWNKECERLSEQNCPCILAEVNACPVCDHLKGYDLCNCDWADLCVIQNYQWGEIKKENDPDINILDRIYLSNNCLMLVVVLPLYMEQNLSGPGTWITFSSSLFSKVKDISGFTIEIFNKPGIFTVSIDVRDPEKRYLAENAKELKIKTIENKLLGIHILKNIEKSNVLFALNEIFTPCAISIAETIDRVSNNIDAIIYKENSFVENRLKKMGVNILDIDITTLNSKNIKSLKKGYDLILFGMKDNICNDIGILREEIKQSSLVSMLYL